MEIKLTYSGFERAKACIPSVLLPHVGSIRADSTAGTVKHRFLERVPAVGRDAALAEVPEEFREACAVIDLSPLPASKPGQYAPEVAFAYDLATDTARELGRGIDRKYREAGLRDGEIPGTLDSVGIDDDTVLVLDFKSGWGGHVQRAAENDQLRIGALAAARAYGKSRARVAIAHIPDDGDPWLDWAELDEMDLEAVAAEVRGLVARAAEEADRMGLAETPRTVEGEHCRWCPAFPHCPAKMTLVRQLATESPEPFNVPELTAETAPKMVERLLAAEEVLERVRSTLETYARQQPVRLANGKVFGPVALPRESIDPAKGSVVLTERFGADVAIAACETETSMTKALLKRGLRRWVDRTPGAKISHAEKAALEAMRQAGAIRVTTTSPVKVYQPHEEPPPPTEKHAPALPSDFHPVEVAQ